MAGPLVLVQREADRVGRDVGGALHIFDVEADLRGGGRGGVRRETQTCQVLGLGIAWVMMPVALAVMIVV